MTSYFLHDIDPALWADVKRRAAGAGMSVKAVILQLLRAWIAGDVVLTATGRTKDGGAA